MSGAKTRKSKKVVSPRRGREGGSVMTGDHIEEKVVRGGAVGGEVMPGRCALPCPVAADPAMGDKTPAVMAWYREYQPEEFKRRYGNRVCPEAGEVTVRRGDDEERGPVSDFEDEEDEVVVKPRVIMG